MNRSHTRRLAAWLAALTLSSTLIACGGASDGGTDTTAAPAVTTAAPAGTTVPEETRLTANIPEGTNFGGYVFNIANGFHNATKYTTNAIAPTEATGDVLNDAIYKRTVTVEEKLGIDIVDLDITQAKAKTFLQAADTSFDLMTVDLAGTRGFFNENLVLDFNEMPNIDLSMPWWDQNAQEKLSIDGKLWYALSDFLITHLDNSRGLYFNKQLFTDLQLEDPYQLVRDGKWTLDKLREMGLQAVSDLDGNQVMNEYDRYGMTAFANPGQLYEAFLTASESEIMQQGSNGIPYFYCYEDRFLDVAEKLLAVFNTDDFTYYPPKDSITTFMENRSLFLTWTLYAATQLRAMDTDFGILPLPKYDENQADYWCVCPQPHTLMIPLHVDQERTGTILEAMAYYSSPYYNGEESVTYAYFEKAVKGKTTRDAESLEMLDIIKNSISYLIKLDDSAMTNAISTAFKNGQNQFSTIIAKTKKAADKTLENVYASMGVTVD